MGLFIVEGEHLVEEAYKHNLLESVYSLDETSYQNSEVVSENVMRKLSNLDTIPNIIGVCKFKEEKELGNKCIMISVHGNAMGNGDWMQGRGWEVYTTRKKTNSDKLAKCFLEVFEDIFPDQTLRGHKEADFTVIYKTNCPCVLTENFFFDNKEDCQLMMSMEGKIRIAKLHVEAIKKYYNEIC
jgi:hypothetical protein